MDIWKLHGKIPSTLKYTWNGTIFLRDYGPMENSIGSGLQQLQGVVELGPSDCRLMLAE